MYANCYRLPALNKNKKPKEPANKPAEAVAVVAAACTLAAVTPVTSAVTAPKYPHQITPTKSAAMIYAV